MAQAIVDPEELERFARNLNDFTNHLLNGMRFLDGCFNNLGVTWRDQEHQKFEQQYRETEKNLRRFLDVSKAHTIMLHKKAEHVRNYLKQK